MTESTNLQTLAALTAKEEAGAVLTDAERTARRSICDALEALHPELNGPLEEWLGADDDDRSGGRVILDTLKPQPSS